MPSEQTPDDTAHDVLIHAGSQDLAHKWTEKLAADEQAYWRVNGTPRQTEPGQRVWFEYNGTIHAWGEIVDLEDGRIWFDGAHEVHLPCLDDAPTRGFTYIQPLLPRLQEAEWHVEPTGEIVLPDGGIARRCETEGCHRETEYVVNYPDGDEENRDRGMCSPCKTVFLNAVGRARNEVAVSSTETDQDGGSNG